VWCLPLPLVERSQNEIADAVRKRIGTVQGVRGVGQLDVRVSGKRLDVSAVLLVDSNLTWEDTHRIALAAERTVMSEYPGARVVINTEPFGIDAQSVWKLAKKIADDVPGSRGVHNVHLQRIDEKLYVDLHLEVSANLTVKQAHEIADQVEKKIKSTNSNISEVTVHIESASERVSREMSRVETELESFVEHIAKSFPEVKDICDINVRRVGNATHLVLRCRFDPDLSIEKAHKITSKIEREIRGAYPEITRIDIHEEPV
jgi:divalent metal cation (Fe/Co/Zn/Cd) transporter